MYARYVYSKAIDSKAILAVPYSIFTVAPSLASSASTVAFLDA